MVVAVNGQTHFHFRPNPAPSDFFFCRTTWFILVYNNDVYDFSFQPFFFGNVSLVALQSSANAVAMIMVLHLMCFVVKVIVSARLVFEKMFYHILVRLYRSWRLVANYYVTQSLSDAYLFLLLLLLDFLIQCTRGKERPISLFVYGHSLYNLAYLRIQHGFCCSYFFHFTGLDLYTHNFLILCTVWAGISSIKSKTLSRCSMLFRILYVSMVSFMLRWCWTHPHRLVKKVSARSAKVPPLMRPCLFVLLSGFHRESRNLSASLVIL